MFRFKQEQLSSSSNESQSSSESDNSISSLINLVQNIQLNIEEVKEKTLPSLQSDLAKVQKKLRKRQSEKTSKSKTATELKQNFKQILVQSKWGIKKGDRATILNKINIQGYIVPDKYKTGSVLLQIQFSRTGY